MTDKPNKPDPGNEPIHRVLLVEDSVVTAKLLEGILKRSKEFSFTIDTADTLAGALDQIAENDYQVIFLDLGLPDSQGLDTFHKVRETNTRAAIIVESGDDDRNTAIQAIRHGAQDYLLKNNINAEIVLRMVKYAQERKRILEAAIQAQETSATIVEKSPFGVVVVGRDYRIRSVNETARGMLGIECHDTLNGLDFSDYLKPWHEWDGGERPPSSQQDNTERELKRQDGTGIPVISTCLPITLDGEDVLLVNLVDITERKQAEADLARAQKLESVGQLAAGIAHEINTPIQFVSDNLRFLKESLGELLGLTQKHVELVDALEAEDKAKEQVESHREALEEADVDYLREELPLAIEQSLEGAERVAKIVRAMKEFSHPGSNEIKASDLTAAIKTTITVARNEWKYAAEMKTELDPELPLVPCLVGELNQVVLNLIVNARDAIVEKREKDGDPEAKGVITITTGYDEQWATIRVSDTGAGIPEEIKKRIFDPFFTTKEVGKGSGQGLAIAHCVIVDKHGGQLAVESTPGEGTTFIIRLPLEVADEEQAEDEVPCASGCGAGQNES